MTHSEIIAACDAFDGSAENFAEILSSVLGQIGFSRDALAELFGISIDALDKWAAAVLLPRDRARRASVIGALRARAGETISMTPPNNGNEWLGDMLVLSQQSFALCMGLNADGLRRRAEDVALGRALKTKKPVLIVGPGVTETDDEYTVTLLATVKPSPICMIQHEDILGAAACDQQTLLKDGRPQGNIPDFPAVLRAKDGRLYSSHAADVTCRACLTASKKPDLALDLPA